MTDPMERQKQFAVIFSAAPAAARQLQASELKVGVSINAPERQAIAELTAFLDNQPAVWRKPGGDLTGAEYQARVELMTKYAGPAVQRFFAELHGGITLAQYVTACNNVDRENFIAEMASIAEEALK